MTWFTATSVTVNNGQTVVSVNAGDDIQLAQESGGLIIGNNPPVEIKRSYLDGSNNKKIELRSAWPYANQAAQPAVAFPTDGDLAAATAVLKQLIDGFALATQAQAEQGANNTAAMTALRVKQAIDFFRPLTTSANDTTAGRVWRTNDLVKTTSGTDASAGRMLKVGDFGIGTVGDAIALPNDPTIPFGFYRSDAIIYPNQSAIINFGFRIARKAQIAADIISSTPRFYGRAQPNDNTWGPIVEFYTTRNTLGTVSQSAGVPTGAIIQRGSNANGEFVRFADGMQICTRDALPENTSAVHGSAYAAGFRTVQVQVWTFPIAFSSAPHCSVRFNGALDSGLASSLTTTNFSPISWVPVSGTYNVTARDLIAIGRWF